MPSHRRWSSHSLRLAVSARRSRTSKTFAIYSRCQYVIFTTGVMAIVSIGIGNALVLLRVLVLWQDNKRITRFLWGGYFLSFLVMTSMMFLTCAKALPGIIWSPITRMCVPTTKGPSLAATWGASLFFELMVIYLVAYHVLSSPRSAETQLTKSLRQHGLAFFLLVFAIRLANTFVSIFARPSLVYVALPFVWSAVTVNLNRSLLRLRRADIRQYLLPRSSAVGRATSPFGLFRASAGPDFAQDILNQFDDIKTEVADEVRLRRLEYLPLRPREISIPLGDPRHPRTVHITPALPLHHFPV